MDAVEYLKEKGRMTKKCNINCKDCPLRNNGTAHTDCDFLEENMPEQAVAIVETWAKEHPVKTYLSVLLEKLPNIKLHNNGTPLHCPSHYFKASNVDCHKVRCWDCWNREYKEETNDSI